MTEESTIKEKLVQYFNLQREIYRYFGYEEDWTVYPIDDLTDCYWILDEERKFVLFHEDYLDQDLLNSELYYCNSIMDDPFLPKSVYSSDELTMVLVDTHQDGNRFLSIFDNSKRIQEAGLVVNPFNQ